MEYISFFISVGIAIYLFVVAPKFGKSRWLWAIMGFIFGLIALGIFFIKTNRKVLGWILVILSIIFYVFVFLVAIALFSFVGANI
ncbi:hypothetical protein [Pseudoneobacillus rhizosphaerae]|jgi:hypothetical protein|uniref:Uncharacterized protein n=1 Tax=Pseudoneobacillus rhizosphaerae TaxID=2880968 RepID=A0A9C7L969_9BACI|nr:hypothetical protein [Pseudoneobacillus rhizosphaerae]CAG9606992.1 hypothetical protein NEOCIP111885_00680 [Pseudoneobacillus rhizosphaerae]